MSTIMKDLSSIPAPTRAEYHQKIAKFYRLMHERSAKTIMGLTGAAVVLPLAAEAQVSPAQINIDDVSSIRDYELQGDGSVRATLSNGQKVLITEQNVFIAADGSLLISELAAEELLLASDSAYGMIGVSTGQGVAAALGGALGLTSILGSEDLITAITKVIQVVDAPVQGAAVFYDTNNNDAPDSGEFLGITDENGAVSVTYEPVAGASIIILPLPISEGDSDALFGADADAVEAEIVAAYNEQFPDANITDILEASTNDVVTGNVFDLFLSAPDDSDLDTQVVSPLSTLVDQGVDEDALKEFLGIDASVDLNTYNPYEVDLSTATAQEIEDAAEVAAATVAAANLLETVIAAAESQGGDNGALDASEELEAATQAVQNLNTVLTALQTANVAATDLGSSQAEQIAALTEITTVVATVDVLDGDADVADGETSLSDALATEIATDLAAASAGGDIGGDATAVIETATTSVVNDANQVGSTIDTGDIVLADLQETIDEVEDVAVETADANQQATANISQAVTDAATDAEDGATLATDGDFEDVLDAEEDNVTEIINEAVNENLTESALEGDDDFALEFQTTLTKGNVFENDLAIQVDGNGDPILVDGVAQTEDLASDTTIFAVNGTEMGGTLVQSTQTTSLLLSTADWGTPEQTVAASVLESNLGLANDALPLSTSNAFWSPYAQWWGTDIDDATAGSAAYTSITVAAGDTISFDYVFSAYEYVPYTDYAFVSLVGTAGDADGSSLVLRNTDAAENPGTQGGPFDVSDLKGDGLYTQAGTLVSSAEQTFTYTFDTAGTYTFGIGITDVVDTIFDSMIQVTSITQTDNSGDTPVETAVDLGTLTQLGNVAEDTEVNTEVSAVVATGAYGTLTMNANGDYYYTMGTANADPLPAGEFETDNFTYTIQQEDGTFATSLLTINVLDVDLTATINGDTNSVTEGNQNGSTISGTVSLPDAATDFIVGGFGEVNITVTDENDNEVDVGAVTITDGAFSVSDVDLSSLVDGELTVTMEVAYTLQGLDETFAGSDESVENHLLEATSTSTKELLDDGEPFTAEISEEQTSLDDSTVTVTLAGLDAGSDFTMTVTDGETSVTLDAATANGEVEVDISSFALGAQLTITGVLSNGNVSESVSVGSTTVAAVQNVGTSTMYGSLSEAISAASEADTLLMAAGDHSEVSPGPITVDKSLTINGAHAGSSAKPATNDDLDPANPRGAGETETTLGNMLYISADNVTIDGVTLASDGPLSWNESLEDGLNGFTLQNSVMIGYTGENAPSFNANSDADLGKYDGGVVTDSWTFSGNLIGGMTQTAEDTSNHGTMYLSGISNLDVSDNMFWRPTAGHLYMSSIEDATIDGNSFYHGLHAGGVALDGYDGDTTGYGYGYGYGGEGQNPETPYYGRNFWLEIKGDNANVEITNNSGQYNSGGIQVYGLNDGFAMDGLTISGNTFSDFVNADPLNILSAGRTGFMGAINVQLGDDSAATDIVISENTVTAALDQISGNGNELNLISVTGNDITDGDDAGTGSVTITGNTVTWVETSSAEIAALTDVADPGEVTVSAIKVDGAVSDTIDISSNTLTNQGADQPSIGVYLITEGDDEGESDGPPEGMSTDLTVDNTYSGFDNGASSNIRIEGFSLNGDLNDLDFGGEVPQLIVDIGDDGESQQLVGDFTLGDGTDDAYVGSATTNFVFLAGGANTADLSSGGIDAVLVDALAPGETVDITGFTAGNPQTNDNADFVALFNTGDASLQDVGFAAQITDADDTIGDETGLLVFSNALDFGADTEAAIAAAVDGLDGETNGDIYYVAASDGSETVLAQVQVGAAGSTATEIATFTDITDATTVAGNIVPFELQGLPEV